MKTIRFFAILFLFLSVRIPAETSREIVVSAAMSLKNAFTEIGNSYESKRPGVKVVFNFAGSGQLKAQIESGAPVDLFASASPEEMNALEAKGLIQKETRRDFAKNSLVFIAGKEADPGVKQVADLTRNGVKKIAIGNPDTVPAGRYAREALTFYKVFAPIADKLVFGENVRQVLDYVSRGEVDAGFVYSSDLTSVTNVRVIAKIPDEAHAPIVYPIAVVRNSKRRELSIEFIAFVTSNESRPLLEKYGFQ